MKLAIASVLFLASALPAAAQPAQHWVASWSASQQIPEPANALPVTAQQPVTLREVVHLSLGGSSLRVHLSNAFGRQPLEITSAHIAVPGKALGETDAATDHALSFNGSPSVSVPPGAEYLSDPISFNAAPLSSVAVTLALKQMPTPQTGHPGSRSTTFYSEGDLSAPLDPHTAKSVEHWYVLSGIDVPAPPAAYTVVALGDSITDGHAATTNGNDRWTDVMAARLQNNPKTREVAVVNQGIGGNHLLTDGLGPNVLARFDRDVLAQAAVRTVIVLEGINDLGMLSRRPDGTAADHADLVARIIGAYQQILDRAHAQGIEVIGATITPDGGSDYYHPAAADNAARNQINAWIRAAGHFDRVLDFDKLVADPANPDRMLPAYDSGDHLHPGPPGYRAMGEAAAALVISGNAHRQAIFTATENVTRPLEKETR